MELSRDQIKQIQQRLVDTGYDIKNIDGIMSSETIRAYSLACKRSLTPLPPITSLTHSLALSTIPQNPIKYKP